MSAATHMAGRGRHAGQPTDGYPAGSRHHDGVIGFRTMIAMREGLQAEERRAHNRAAEERTRAAFEDGRPWYVLGAARRAAEHRAVAKHAERRAAQYAALVEQAAATIADRYPRQWAAHTTRQRETK